MEAHAYEARLRGLAQGLLATSQNDFLHQARSFVAVRKHLKSCVRALGGSCPGSNSSSSEVPFPDNARASMPHTPMHTPAAVAARSDPEHVAATFVSPLDTTSLQSPGGTPARGSLPYSPGLEEAHKPDWHAGDDVFHGMLDHGSLGAAADHLMASDLTDLQHVWFPQMPGVMDLDTAGPMQWDCPEVRDVDATTTAAAASDMDSVLYYFETGHNKRPC